jgi:5'-nucleotidase
MEAVLHDVPAIAISQVVDFAVSNNAYTLAAKTLRELVIKITEGTFPLPHREFLNINIPSGVHEAKMVVTYAGYRFYANDAHLHRNPRGEEFYWLGLHPLAFKPRADKKGLCDYDAIESGFISLTPVHMDLSAYHSMEMLEEWL